MWLRAPHYIAGTWRRLQGDPSTSYSSLVVWAYLVGAALTQEVPARPPNRWKPPGAGRQPDLTHHDSHWKEELRPCPTNLPTLWVLSRSLVALEPS